MYFVEKTREFNYFKQFDYLLFTAVLLLSSIGLLVVSSATLVMPNDANGGRMVLVQAVGLLLGIVISLIIGAIDYKDFKILGIFIYLFSISLLVLVLVIGERQQGSKSWFAIPGIGGFQPSEFGKIAFIVLISIFLERIKDGNPGRKNKIKVIFYSLIPIGLVMAQPDAGTAMVFIFIFCVMIFVCEMPYKYIFITGGAFLSSLPFLWFFVLKSYQKDRILAFLYPELDPQGKGYNVLRAKMAIGSGQIHGKGLYHGIQTQSKYGVPVKESDFIFSVIGEELGFIGAVLIVVLMLFILMRCIYIAKNSRDLYGAFLVVGLTGMMGFHFLENIGMCIGILPVTGIPLPFISAGGSAMVTNYIAVGIILSVSMRRKRTIFNSSQ